MNRRRIPNRKHSGMRKFLLAAVVVALSVTTVVTPLAGQDSAERRFAFTDENGAITEIKASDPMAAQRQLEGKGTEPDTPRLQFLGEIIRSFPTGESYDVGDIGPGLEWRDGRLWYSSEKANTLYELDPIPGARLNSYPKLFPMRGDMAWDGTRFGETDAANGLIRRYDPAQTSAQPFVAPGSTPVGMARDATNIWVHEEATDRIYARDRTNGSVVRSIFVPDVPNYLTGLAFDGAVFWVYGRLGAIRNALHRIDRMSGEVLYSFRCIVHGGLAFDGRYLWAADWENDFVWRIIQIDVSWPPQVDPMIEWKKQYDAGGEFDRGSHVQQTPDRGYILCGWTDTTDGYDFYLLKTDRNGNKQWEKTFAKGSSARCLDQTFDGGFVLVGYVDSVLVGTVYENYLYMVKTDSNGNLQWDRTFDSYRRGCWIEKTTDGGYLAAGFYYASGSTSYYVYLLKTDSLGNMQWERILGNAHADCVRQTRDGGYIIAARDYPSGDSPRLIKTDANGSVQWERVFSGGSSNSLVRVRQTMDAGYVFANTASDDLLICKTDAYGFAQWVKRFGGAQTEWAYDVVESRDGSFVAVGFTRSFSVVNAVYLIKADRHGNLQWQKTFQCDYPGTGTAILGDNAYSIEQTADRGYTQRQK